jgi:hypothetical protein
MKNSATTLSTTGIRIIMAGVFLAVSMAAFAGGSSEPSSPVPGANPHNIGNVTDHYVFARNYSYGPITTLRTTMDVEFYLKNVRVFMTNGEVLSCSLAGYSTGPARTVFSRNMMLNQRIIETLRNTSTSIRFSVIDEVRYDSMVTNVYQIDTFSTTVSRSSSQYVGETPPS